MTFAWQRTSPAEAGFAADLEQRIDDTVRGGGAPNLHGVVVVRNNRLVLERYGSGEDFKWEVKSGNGKGSRPPIGQQRPRVATVWDHSGQREALRTRSDVVFGPTTLHDIRSITKGIVGMLYGIALADGLVPEPEEQLLSQFPEYPDLAGDPRRSLLTIEHALTMTLGLEWNEEPPYTSAENSDTAMSFSPDPDRFVLERPIVEEPGRRWLYCGGATALIGRLIVKGTGKSLPEFARLSLFEPMGINHYEWFGREGVAFATWGLRMSPCDLARVGQIVLDRGQAEDRGVIPVDWIEAALTPRVMTERGNGYGYHWYVLDLPSPVNKGRSVKGVGATGNGGQRLIVVADLNLVVVITAGNYDSADQSTTPTAIWDLILSSIEH